MPSKSVPPSISEVAFACPHCGAYTHQHWYGLHAIAIRGNNVSFLPDGVWVETLRAEIAMAKGPEGKEKAQKFFTYAKRVFNKDLFLNRLTSKYGEFPEVANLHISVCYTCEEVAVWVADRLVCPPAGPTDISPNEDLHDDIKRDFREAAQILDQSPRGAAALLRLCIQKVCKQLGESGKNINDDIASLVQKGLPVEVQQALDIVWVVGNDAVHPGLIDLQDDTATAVQIFELTNMIADARISQPKRIADMYNALPANKLKAIAERDKPKGGAAPAGGGGQASGADKE